MRTRNLDHRAIHLLLACLTLGVGFAQDAAKTGKKPDEAPVPGGTVTGRVVFADTNGPARFTKVLLKSTAPSDPGDNPFAAMLSALPPAPPGRTSAAPTPKLSAADEAEKKQAHAAATRAMSSIADLLVSTTVGADGSYLFTNVKAGTYYVHASAPGYIDPLSKFSSDDLASSDPAMQQKIAAVAVLVHVAGTDQSRADLRLERGASVSGRVLYDDGTPAAGWVVRTVHEAPSISPSAIGAMGSFSAMGVDMADLDLAHISEMSQTDDTGHFRIAGLATGDYLLQARFTAPSLGHSSFNPISGSGGMADMQGLKLTVFSGNVLRRGDAKSVSIRAGDERNGYDLTVPLHAMHGLSGVVRAKSDGHTLNSGTVELSLENAQGKPTRASISPPASSRTGRSTSTTSPAAPTRSPPRTPPTSPRSPSRRCSDPR